MKVKRGANLSSTLPTSATAPAAAPGLTLASAMQASPAAGITPAAATSSVALSDSLTRVARAKAGMAPPRLGQLPQVIAGFAALLSSLLVEVVEQREAV
ncbi:hypothetical protein E2562_002106 [Oryza meyeriana var. granulata]|uniref:Uncharacterized protein n=1 Tax=Oryza meyeriana var. granulata TaxID=110450 RepID=A0A6G1EE43_9ORYZ|nr:hypothetical protein E2562_002106 [Oryza meyeriana var. granulata]